jgi:two-component system chemotaxis response regulator CheY
MRALIVDDSAAARELARVVVEDALEGLSLSMPVVVVDGGVSALREIAEGDVALLVCDLHMPDLHGLEVVSFWKQRSPDDGLAVIVTTQLSDRDREKALSAGAAGLLNKPLSTEDLEELVAQRAQAWSGR